MRYPRTSAAHSLTALLLTILAVLELPAQTALERRGIDFEHNLSTAFASAKKSGRPILVDAMTTWCAPCLQMEREVFRDPSVGAFVNEHFEAVQLDMERAEGPRVGRDYGVRAYPTLLILDAKGRELDRQVGYADMQRFLEFVAPFATETGAASGPAEGSFAALDNRFRAGIRDTSQLVDLIEFAERADHPATPEYVLAYLETTGDYESPTAVDLVLRHAATDNALFDILVARRKAYAAIAGDYEVSSSIALALDAGLFPGEAPVKNRRAKRLVAKAYPDSEAAADSTYIRFRMRRAREAGKAKRYGKWALRWQDRYPTNDPDELDELVYIFEERLPGWREEEVARWKARRDELRGEQTF